MLLHPVSQDILDCLLQRSIYQYIWNSEIFYLRCQRILFQLYPVIYSICCCSASENSLSDALIHCLLQYNSHIFKFLAGLNFVRSPFHLQPKAGSTLNLSILSLTCNSLPCVLLNLDQTVSVVLQSSNACFNKTFAKSPSKRSKSRK